MIYQFLLYTIPHIPEGGKPDRGVRQERGRKDG